MALAVAEWVVEAPAAVATAVVEVATERRQMQSWR